MLGSIVRRGRLGGCQRGRRLCWGGSSECWRLTLSCEFVVYLWRLVGILLRLLLDISIISSFDLAKVLYRMRGGVILKAVFFIISFFCLYIYFKLMDQTGLAWCGLVGIYNTQARQYGQVC